MNPRIAKGRDLITVIHTGILPCGPTSSASHRPCVASRILASHRGMNSTVVEHCTPKAYAARPPFHHEPTERGIRLVYGLEKGYARARARSGREMRTVVSITHIDITINLVRQGYHMVELMRALRGISVCQAKGGGERVDVPDTMAAKNSQTGCHTSTIMTRVMDSNVDTSGCSV